LAVADRRKTADLPGYTFLCQSPATMPSRVWVEFQTVNARMAWLGSQFSTELESRLREGLSTLRAVAGGLGANSVSVFLVRNGRIMRTLYMWPEFGTERVEVKLERPPDGMFRNLAGYAAEDSPIAGFLRKAFQPGGTSFLIFSWGMDPLKTVIAFGFARASAPEGVALSQSPCAVSLASVAAWSVYEVFRLHFELAVANDRLGARKLIERAKGKLQAERGLDEQEAYAHLRRLSRQRRMRMSEVATDLLGAWRFP
jgi:hypothetical protein